MIPTGNSTLKPLETLNSEFDPNFLERLGVKEKVQTATLAYARDETDQNLFNLIVATTAELFYLKACVNCMNHYDPVAARANAYLATTGYDLYVTRVVIKAENENQNTEENRKHVLARFLQTVRTMNTKKVNRPRNHLHPTRTTMNDGVKAQHEDSVVPTTAITIDSFVDRILRFYRLTDEEMDRFDNLQLAKDKLSFFADKVIYPFALQCNEDAREFYNSLGSDAYSVKLFTNSSKEHKKFHEISNEEHRSRGGKNFVVAQEWIHDMFGILLVYQGVLTNTENNVKFNLRSFRSAYAKVADLDSNECSDRVLEITKHSSPFLKLDFLFKLKEKGIFNCFDPNKLTLQSINSFKDAVENATNLTKGFGADDLELVYQAPQYDAMTNAFLFEKFLGRNFYNRFKYETIQ